MSYKQQLKERAVVNSKDKSQVIKDFKQAFSGVDMSDLSFDDLKKMLMSELGLDKKEAGVIANGLIKK